jgi:hypothetical protein
MRSAMAIFLTVAALSACSNPNTTRQSEIDAAYSRGEITLAQRNKLTRWRQEEEGASGSRLPAPPPSADSGIRPAQAAQPPSNYPIASQHWIKRVIEHGELIVLEDGTIWQINQLDRINTMLWLPIDNIQIVEGDLVGHYVLVNTSQKQNAGGVLVGRDR